MVDIVRIIVLVVMFALVVIGIGLLCALPVMFLWNWLVPSILHLREIDFIEAWGLLVLCGFLFKSAEGPRK